MKPNNKRRITVQEGYSLHREIRLDSPLTTTVDGVTLAWRPPTSEERSAGFQEDVVFCVGRLQRTVNKRVGGLLDVLAEGRLPPGTQTWTTLAETFTEGSALEGHIPPLSILPEGIRDALGGTATQVRDAVVKGTRILRWRSGATRMHAPLGAVVSLHRWSFDEEQWHPLPTDTFASVEDTTPLGFKEALAKEVERLAAEETTEPVAHSLWREAWALRQRGPHSALLIGVAAAEVGFKEMVADLVPDAKWLAENAPSPPLANMLRDFLPLLPVRNTFDKEVLPPPQETLNLVKKAVFERNQTTHKGSPVTGERAEEVLLALRDLLWLYDYYRGHSWAAEKMAVKPTPGQHS